jgi:PPOX class probable F420-dependent enzyme
MQSIPAEFRDLLDGQVATLATVAANGRPQLTIVWFLAEGDSVRFSLNTTRQKTVNLFNNPSCSVVIVDPASDYRYLELRGTVEIEPDPDYAFADKVGAKYGSDLRVHDQPGDTRAIATLVTDRVRPVDMRS